MSVAVALNAYAALSVGTVYIVDVAVVDAKEKFTHAPPFVSQVTE